jgi:Rrf2 family protein
MMKLTRASSYALHAVSYMASRKNSDAVASHVIAQDRRIPERFLLKVLKPLVAADILRSIKGPNGGYRLARPANDITMLEVVEAVEGGPLRGAAPPNDKNPGSQLDKRLNQICSQAADQVRKQLGKVKISELATRD